MQLDTDARLLETHRVALTGYCYRMLGSAFDAEDAAQETLVRAWRGFDRFDERRSALRSWLFTIATNICLDMLRGARRRARVVDLGPAATPGAPLGAPLPETAWLHPVPDALVVPVDGDPAEQAVRRETIRLAFVAALQHLPPRQRAVLILRDVLAFSAEEVAALLDGTTAAVNSALQRARATLRSLDVRPGTADPIGPAQQDLLDRYCKAFEAYDVATLVSLLHEDATMSMPPFSWWLCGREDIRTVLLAAGRPCEGSRMEPTVANGSPAFRQYRPEPFAIVVVGIRDGLITDLTTYLDGDRLFRLFADR